MNSAIMSLHIKAFVIGMVAGLGGGLFSLGGGTLTIPLMLRWLRLDEFNARGTALAVAFFPALAGAFFYYQAGQVDWQTVLFIAIPALIITPLAGLWTEHLSASRFRHLFGVIVISGALLLILRDELLGGWFLHGNDRYPYLVGVGIIEGLVAGSVGISGGPVLAPLLVLGLGMPQQLAQGCSLAARVPAVVTGVIENYRNGHICLRILPGLVVGGLLGARLGSHIALALPELHLRSLFALLLVLLGIRYLFGRR